MKLPEGTGKELCHQEKLTTRKRNKKHFNLKLQDKHMH